MIKQLQKEEPLYIYKIRHMVGGAYEEKNRAACNGIWNPS